MELVDDVVVALSPDAGNVADPRIDESTRQLPRTRVEIVSLTAKLFD